LRHHDRLLQRHGLIHTAAATAIASANPTRPIASMRARRLAAFTSRVAAAIESVCSLTSDSTVLV